MGLALALLATPLLAGECAVRLARGELFTLDPVRALDTHEALRSGDPEITTRLAQYELAWRMQSSVPELLDLGDEPRDDQLCATSWSMSVST